MEMSAHFCTVFISLLPNLAIASLSISPAILSTTLGDVTGIRKAAGDNKLVDVFYSIPFAKPPVGDLRFRHPVPAESWVGTLDGTQKPHSCWQPIDTQFERFPGVEMWNPNTPRSEDCLYLNVWRPLSIGKHSESNPKAILVWIYGGGFYSGTTTLDVYDATQLAARNDVIVVSIAYRLGPLGFLYFGSDEAPGNSGLMDQNLGLKWVKNNAVNLGGSPDLITIFGESAGAASVGFHLLSPLSRLHFNYAILQSSAPIASWAFQDTNVATSRTLEYMSLLSCPTDNLNSSINCLKSADPGNLMDKQWNIKDYDLVPFSPVIDGYFLPDNPFRMTARGDIKDTNVLLGVNKNEGYYFNIYNFPEDFPLNGDGQISEDQLDKMLLSYFSNDHVKSERIKEYYLRRTNMSYTNLIDAIYGDIHFKCPVVNFADQLSKHGSDVFLYNFEHRVSTNPWPGWTGVEHGYEIELIFGLPLAPNSGYTDEDKAVSIEMMKLWTNFAKTGNPNMNSTTVSWSEYTTQSKEYVVIEAQRLTIGHGLRQHECSFLANVTELSQRTELPAHGTPFILDTTLSGEDNLVLRDLIHIAW